MASTTTPSDRVRAYAKRLRKEDLRFNSQHIQAAENFYVGWVDLMGAGHAMRTSTQKSANFLARLHMALERSRQAIGFSGSLLAINDGVFVITKSKRELMSMVGRVFVLLSANFIATPKPQDRFLMRGGIAFGPVYSGAQIREGIEPTAFRENTPILESVMFGPAIIQAFKAESAAPPYGVAVHESARAFCSEGDTPFRLTHWPWWAPNEEVDYPKSAPLGEIKVCLLSDLGAHFNWLRQTLIYHEVEKGKIDQWGEACGQYFAIG